MAVVDTEVLSAVDVWDRTQRVRYSPEGGVALVDEKGDHIPWVGHYYSNSHLRTTAVGVEVLLEQ